MKTTRKFPTVYDAQRGIVLVIALIVLVAMTLAGIALVRSIDSASLIAGNLAFRQSATNSGDGALEAAVTAISALTKAQLESNATGYYAFAPAPAGKTDLTGAETPDNAADDFDWDANAATIAGSDTAGNRAQYVVHRLCETGTVALDAKKCATISAEPNKANSPGIATKQKTDKDDPADRIGNISGLYRVTVRITGPRNTHSFLQAIMAR